MKKYHYSGGCHCGNVRFEVSLNQQIETVEISLCNCSMCEKTGYLHLIIPKKDLDIKSDWDSLKNYQFNKKIAKHLFCKNCGIKSFYQPRSHPDCWSINARCLDDFANLNLKISHFDGKNWEANIDSLLK